MQFFFHGTFCEEFQELGNGLAQWYGNEIEVNKCFLLAFYFLHTANENAGRVVHGESKNPAPSGMLQQ